MQKNTKAAYARKDNFWNKQRVDKGLTHRDIAEYLHKDQKIVAAYFSGFLLPPEDTIRRLCDWFEVDFGVGNLEFQHAHRQYKAEHNLGVAYSSRKTKAKKKAQTKNTEINSVEDVLEVLYGKLSCGEFLTIYRLLTDGPDNSTNPLEIIYHKVDDYKTFYRIASIIGGTGDGVIG